jgi:thiamine monophosphate kinase
MLNGGGEYELMFTFRKDHLEALHSSDIDLTVIGVVTESGLDLITEGKAEPLENRGYEHFTKD